MNEDFYEGAEDTETLEEAIEDDAVKSASKKDWKAFAGLLKRSKIPWLLIAVAFGLSVASAKVSVLFPDYSIQFFEAGDITRRTIISGIGLLVLAAVLSIAKSCLEAWLRTDISMRLRDNVLERVLSLRLADVNRMNPRELISRTANDTGLLSDFLVTVLMVIAGELFHFYFALDQIREYSINLLIVQLIFIPVSLFAHWIQGGFAYRFQYKTQFRLSKLTEYLSERLVNIPIIKIFTKERAEIRNGEAHIDEYAKVRVKFALIDVLFVMVEDILRLSNRIVAILYGGYLVHKGVLDIGVWIAYYMLVEQASMNLDLIAAQWPVLKSVQGAVTRTAAISELPEEDREGSTDIDRGANLAFEDFSLSLKDKEILKGITSELHRGQKIAIVGTSGSGKSTLLNALVRFYDADSGRLMQGKSDVKALDLSKYREQFGYVFQDIKLFSESLRFNLCYGAGRDVSDDEIIEKCKMAGLEGFLNRQDEGLDTRISEGGSNLSGGELQRVGLVRALLRNPEIIILDEATANLDAETEETVLSALEGRMGQDEEPGRGGKTLIMVAHRIDLVKDADHIIYMDDGRILAEGNHEELIRTCEPYRLLSEADGEEVQSAG